MRLLWVALTASILGGCAVVPLAPLPPYGYAPAPPAAAIYVQPAYYHPYYPYYPYRYRYRW